MSTSLTLSGLLSLALVSPTWALSPAEVIAATEPPAGLSNSPGSRPDFSIDGTTPPVLSPIQLQSATWVSNVSSWNTLEGRDLGFQGQVGSCYVDTFGDTYPCASVNPQENCTFVLDQRNSGAVTRTHVARYEDIHVSPEGRVSAPFVPHIENEQPGFPLGITNVISTGKTTGAIYYLAGDGTYIDGNGANPYFVGAGVATITSNSSCGLNVTRPEINMWYGNRGPNTDPYNETFYGDHGVMTGQDGYLYTYGTIPNVKSPLGIPGVGLARVLPENVADITKYTYWNGLTFTAKRQYDPTAVQAVMYATQGSPTWNPYYKQYVYYTAFGLDDSTGIYVLSSPLPQGPWTSGPTLFRMKDMVWSYTYNSSAGHWATFYSPSHLPKFSDSTGKSSMVQFTYIVDKADDDDDKGHQVITAVNMIFD